MKKLVFLILSSLCFADVASAQFSKVLDSCRMQSTILQGERKYAVYLPPGFDTSSRSYPVLYLLHGSGDDQTGWVQFGEVQSIADKAIADGKATPMVIVMPDANTGTRGYFNDAKGEWRYEDFFFQEFMPFVEKEYRIKSEKRYRAVAGLSMGGGGSFMYALHHPELFSSACPLSASTGPLSFEEAKERALRVRPGEPNAESKKPTEEQLKSHYLQHSVLELVNRIPDDQKKAVRWSTSRCGRKRSHTSFACAMAVTNGAIGVNHFQQCWHSYRSPFIKIRPTLAGPEFPQDVDCFFQASRFEAWNSAAAITATE
jgi:pimeloyl-ACP methyl ester carboxylesterase